MSTTIQSTTTTTARLRAATDLLDERRGPRPSGLLLTARRSLHNRREAWLRRELDAGQTARAQRRETGGDYSLLP